MRRAVRARPGSAAAAAPSSPVGDIGPDTDWRAALDGVRCVVHLAARTHVLRETAADPLAEYRRINVAGTRAPRAQAAAAGVRRLVFVSSVKVNGERTGDAPVHRRRCAAPRGRLRRLEVGSGAGARPQSPPRPGLEVVVLRPPLVYGPGVKGNFLRLMDLVARGVPLPLARVDNRRSLDLRRQPRRRHRQAHRRAAGRGHGPIS